ncbi:hypothetical protein NIES2107_75610 (plasmid) [Nostoc carneum NIES-2107]|nr:hypothetical protein NIES2107_75610 [Nostoc carneum NIES-2107]
MWKVEYLNAELLDLKLWGEGCRLYQIRSFGDDEICLIQTDDTPQESLCERWQVVYTERGAVQQGITVPKRENCTLRLKAFLHRHLSHPFSILNLSHPPNSRTIALRANPATITIQIA